MEAVGRVLKYDKNLVTFSTYHLICKMFGSDT